MKSLSDSEDIEKIYKITHILGCKVEIQPIRGSKLIPQCKKCQAFGHTQKFCSKEPRCVKCASRHLTRECQKLETQNPKYVNCGEGHPANYRGCIVAKELKKIKNKKAMKGKPVKNIVPKDTIIQQNVRPNNLTKGTYASVAASGMNHQRTQNLEYNDINQTLQLSLTKFTNLDGALSKLNEQVKKLESNNKKTAPNSKNKNG
jgi:hypothetical protein